MIPFPNKRYQIILADPPWRYDFSRDNSDKIEVHYPTMSIEEIKLLPIPFADNAVLYLWATAPKLLEALSVMRAWGFIYKTHGIWDKEWIGMGYWFRGQHELLLVGVRGKHSAPLPSYRVSSVYRERRTEHSRKPAYFRDLIAKTFPDEEKIELFAREKVEGWDSIGFDIDGCDIRESLDKFHGLLGQ